MIWRALSVRQPWAWLIVNGFKDIENRTRPLSYRGPLLIHASQKMTEGDYDACMIFVGGISCLRLPPPGSLDRGGIVGSVTVMDCVTESSSKWFCGPHSLVLANAKPLPFFPCKGQLSLFSVDLPASPSCHPELGKGSPRGYRCAKCEGGAFELHAPRCPKRTEPVPS